MTDPTPLERLDDAIHDFVGAVDDDATMAGWALVYQTNYLNPEPPEDMAPLTWDVSYSIQNGLSPFAAIGMLDHLRDEISSVYLSVHGAEDDDE
jgi:hypothetical protein